MQESVKLALIASIEGAIKEINAESSKLSRVYLTALSPFAKESYQLSLAANAVTASLAALLSAKDKLIAARDAIAADTQ